jgi:hypothetical protein
LYQEINTNNLKLAKMNNLKLKQKATVTTISNRSFLNFFNSKEIYSIKGFDTQRKAKNYAKKWNIDLFETLPSEVKEFEYCN